MPPPDYPPPPAAAARALPRFAWPSEGPRPPAPQDSVQLLNCRLRIEKVLTVYRLDTQGARYEAFVTLFFRACRALFSDDSISLRNVGPIHQLLSPDGAVPKAALAALLLSKLPHIGAYCATHFVSHLDVIYKQYAPLGLALGGGRVGAEGGAEDAPAGDSGSAHGPASRPLQPGLCLTTQHHFEGGGGRSPSPGKRLGQIFFRAFGRAKFFSGAFGAN